MTMKPSNPFYQPMPSRVFPLVFIVQIGLIIYVAGCDSPTDANDDPEPNEIIMEDHSFTPSNLEVTEGTTVTWINQGNDVHTVTSGSDGDHDGVFDSGSMDPGEEFSFQFDEAGTYDYYCIPHVQVGMTGTVTVTPAD